jgi:tape measure domain-containing protein
MAVETAVITRLSVEDRQFIAGMMRASQAAQGFGTSVQMSQTKMAALAGAVGGVASAVGMSFMQMGKSATQFAFNTVASFEQTRIGFEGILQSGEAAQSFLADLQQFAAKTPFEFTELATASKQLLAVGYAAGDVLPMMSKLGDTAANLGLGSDALQMVIRAFGQIKGAGKAMTQDLYQISNALPGFNPFKAMGDSMGKTQAETRKMVEQGLIPSDKAIAGILEGMAKMPGAAGAMGRQVNTINGQLSNLKDTIQINLIKAFQNTTPAVNALKSIVAGVGPAIAATFKGVGALLAPIGVLFKTLGSVVSAVYAVFKPFLALLGGAFLMAMKGITAALNLFLAPIRGLASFIQSNVGAFRALTFAVVALTIAWNASTIATKLNAIAVKVWAATTAAATAVMKAFQGGLVALNLLMAANPAVVIVAGIATLIAVFMLAWKYSETFREVMTDVFDTVGRVVGAAIGWVLQALGNLVMALGDVLSENSTFGQVIRTIYTAILTVYKFVVMGILKYISTWLTVIADVMDTNGFLGQVIAAVFNFIGKTIFTVVGLVLKAIGWWMETVGTLLDSNGLLGNIIAGVFNFIGKTIFTVVGFVLKAFGMFVGAIGDLLDTNSTLGKIIATIFNFIWSTIAKVVGGILGFFGKWISNLGSFLTSNEDAVNVLVKIFTFLPNQIGNAVKAVLGLFKQILTGLGTLAKGATEKIADLVDKAADLLDKVPGMGKLADAIRKGADGLRSAGTAIQTKLDSVGTSIQGVIDKVAAFQEKMVDSKTYAGLIKGIATVGKTLTDASTKAFTVSEIKMGDIMMNTISGALKTIGEKSKAMGEKVLEWSDIDLGDKIMDMVGGGIKKIGEFVSKAGEKVLDWADIDMGTKLVEFIGKAASGARDLANKVLETVKSIDVEDAVDTVFDKISNVAGVVGQKIFDMGAVVASYTKEGFTGKVADAIGDTIDSIKKKLGLGSAADVIEKSNKEYADAVKNAEETTDPANSIAKQANTMAKVRDAMKKGLEGVQGVLDDLQKAAGDFAKSLKDSITGFAGLAGIELPDGFIPQTKSLIKNMELRLKKSQEFATQVGTLQSLGLNADSLKTILEEGPIKGAQIAASILSGGYNAVQEINRIESQINAVGASLGAIGKEAVYGADIKTATDYIAGLTAGNPSVAQYGNNVTIADGAFRAVINISGLETPEEQLQAIQDGIETKFAEFARALAAKTGA